MKPTERRMPNVERVALVACVAAVILGASRAADAADAAREPTVTRAEAALLERVQTVAATNATAAAALLDNADRPAGSAALDFVLGNLHMERGDHAAAAAAYRAAIVKLPGFVNAHRNLGRALLLAEDPVGAADAFLSVLQTEAADADTCALLGHAYVLAERPVSGEAAYRQALLYSADHHEASRGLTKALIRQSRFAEAAGLAAELLQRHPDDAELWSLRANAALAAGNELEAIRIFETAARLRALGDEEHMTLGDLYINQRQPADALLHYRRVLDRRPSARHTLHAAEALLMLGDRTRATELLAGMPTSAATPDERRRAGLARARIALLDGRPADARTAADAVLSDNPLDGDALLLSGEAAEALGALDAAALAYERAARIDGFRVQGLLAQGSLEAGRGAYAEAIRLFEAAQVLAPRPELARYLEQLGRLAALGE